MPNKVNFKNRKKEKKKTRFKWEKIFSINSFKKTGHSHAKEWDQTTI